MTTDLTRFIKAQENDYQVALSEVKSGKKRSHWMWYIFPQYKGLGFSETTSYYSIKTLHEAKEYLNHPVLGKRLREITGELLKLEQTDAKVIFGSPDFLKLKSSMTLFSVANIDDGNIYEAVLDKFFDGEKDQKTIELLKAEKTNNQI